MSIISFTACHNFFHIPKAWVGFQHLIYSFKKEFNSVFYKSCNYRIFYVTYIQSLWEDKIHILTVFTILITYLNIDSFIPRGMNVTNFSFFSNYFKNITYAMGLKAWLQPYCIEPVGSELYMSGTIFLTLTPGELF